METKMMAGDLLLFSMLALENGSVVGYYLILFCNIFFQSPRVYVILA